ncbi:MAG: alpha,alpha-trehalase, partial [Dinghuibacter sp.]|nr:alpha,alpha-trehalase [Dinghuibacter sp.]
QKVASDFHTTETDLSAHLKSLWKMLERKPDQGKECSSLLPLPHPYIVPGGRFREIYYWDSYFTMLGLKESGETEMIENMVKNFSYLILKYGHIPNGSRNYYLTRSQPPFFSSMVALLASIKGDAVYKPFLPALEKEYAYWMEGSATLRPGQAFKRVVKLKDGTLLNRYWDDAVTPRQESYQPDVETFWKLAEHWEQMGNAPANEIEKKKMRETLYRNLRAAAASGWDFSGRWMKDGMNLYTISTTDIIPVDLHCLLAHLERTLERAYLLMRMEKKRKKVNVAFHKREQALSKFFSKKLDFFSDYNWLTGKTTDAVSAAALFPLNYFTFGHPEGHETRGRQGAAFVRKYLLRDGGLLSTPNNTGQQWDAPNGWAPLQWIAVEGLNKCFQKELARDIAKRWMMLNEKTFAATGKMMEKYNVEDLAKPAGGGEYDGQDGFGWTNGVYLAMKQMFQE